MMKSVCLLDAWYQRTTRLEVQHLALHHSEKSCTNSLITPCKDAIHKNKTSFDQGIGSLLGQLQGTDLLPLMPESPFGSLLRGGMFQYLNTYINFICP